MREIRFRAKRIDNKEWVYGFVYRHDPPLQCLSSENDELPAFAILTTGFADWNMPRPIDQHMVDGNTLGQFTGRKDKNGKEIYEDDWCTAKFRDKNGIQVIQGQIIMDEFMWCIDCTGCVGDDIFSINRPHDFEVIGNAYENPELLNPNPQPATPEDKK